VIALAKDSKDHSRSKHVDVHYHFVQELVEKRIVSLHYIQTTEMLADSLTKPLTGKLHERFVEGLGLRDN
jgi:hypothetical protein